MYVRFVCLSTCIHVYVFTRLRVIYWRSKWQVGEREMNEEMVSVRRQGKGDAGTKSVEEFLKLITEEINTRSSAE